MEESLFVILGATGDLVKTKIFPALNSIKNIKVVTYSRKKPDSIYPAILGDFDNLKPLQDYINKYNFKNVYVYFALPPHLYNELIELFFKSFPEINLHIALEKPFGSSHNEAKEISDTIEKHGEENFYLVDHYNAKKSILDFTKNRNKILNKKIKSVEIAILETERLEKRGAFFDKVGIVKDTVQNHMLLIAQKILDKKIDIHNFKLAPETVVLDQFEGYKNIEGVHPESKTHTYFKASFVHEDIEFNLISAKAQSKNKKYVKINYIDETSHLIEINENSNLSKLPHEHIIEDFVSNHKDLSIKVEDALAQWRIIEQLEI